MLTKAEAIRRHRLMWNWIAQTSIQEQQCVGKDEAFEHFGWPDIRAGCWCCEYIYVESGIYCCIKCPVVWDGVYTAWCCDCDSEFSKWTKAVKKQNYVLAAKYAYMVAGLPERRSMWNEE